MKTLIKNGIILDGSGQSEKAGDILIEDEKIKKISIDRTMEEKADRVLDVRGCFIAPGFVDINNESDHYLTLFSAPEQESLIAQGITTIVVGNNGSSLAPVFKDSFKSIRKWGKLISILTGKQWLNFLSYLKKTKPYLNIASLAGHSTMRRGIIGENQKDLTDKELGQLIILAENCLKEGARGISLVLNIIIPTKLLSVNCWN